MTKLGLTSPQQLSLAANMAQNPALYRSRVKESLDFKGDTYHRKVTTEFDFSASDLGVANSVDLIPLIFRQRALRFQNLEITDADGNYVTNLPRAENESLAQMLIHQVWAQTLESARKSDRKRMNRCSSTSLQIALRKLQQVPVVSTSKGREIHKSVVDYLQANKVFELIQPATRFARLFIRSYIVWVRPPKNSGQRPVLKFSHDTIYDRYSGKRSSWLRWAVGYVPQSYSYWTALASRSETYHFRMNIPDGWHVARQRLSRGDQTIDVRTRAWPNAHLYDGTPALLGPQLIPARARIDLAETPPGSLGAAMLLGSIVTVSLFLLTYFYPFLSCVGAGAVNISAPVLALPSVVAIWTALNLQAHSIVRLPWLSRVAFASSGLSSIVAAVLLGLGARERLACISATILSHSWEQLFLAALFVANGTILFACFARLSRNINSCQAFRIGAERASMKSYEVKNER